MKRLPPRVVHVRIRRLVVDAGHARDQLAHDFDDALRAAIERITSGHATAGSLSPQERIAAQVAAAIVARAGIGIEGVARHG